MSYKYNNKPPQLMAGGSLALNAKKFRKDQNVIVDIRSTNLNDFSVYNGKITNFSTSDKGEPIKICMALEDWFSDKKYFVETSPVELGFMGTIPELAFNFSSVPNGEYKAYLCYKVGEDAEAVAMRHTEGSTSLLDANVGDENIVFSEVNGLLTKMNIEIEFDATLVRDSVYKANAVITNTGKYDYSGNIVLALLDPLTDQMCHIFHRRNVDVKIGELIKIEGLEGTFDLPRSGEFCVAVLNGDHRLMSDKVFVSIEAPYYPPPKLSILLSRSGFPDNENVRDGDILQIIIKNEGGMFADYIDFMMNEPGGAGLTKCYESEFITQVNEGRTAACGLIPDLSDYAPGSVNKVAIFDRKGNMIGGEVLQFRMAGTTNISVQGQDDACISPNPASTYFTVKGSVTKVSVCSISGQQLLSQKVENGSMVDLSSLNQGLYMVRLFMASGLQKDVKLFKK